MKHHGMRTYERSAHISAYRALDSRIVGLKCILVGQVALAAQKLGDANAFVEFEPAQAFRAVNRAGTTTHLSLSPAHGARRARISAFVPAPENRHK